MRLPNYRHVRLVGSFGYEKCAAIRPPFHSRCRIEQRILPIPLYTIISLTVPSYRYPVKVHKIESICLKAPLTRVKHKNVGHLQMNIEKNKTVMSEIGHGLTKCHRVKYITR